jgi:hypothetical protein
MARARCRVAAIAKHLVHLPLGQLQEDKPRSCVSPSRQCRSLATLLSAARARLPQHSQLTHMQAASTARFAPCKHAYKGACLLSADLLSAAIFLPGKSHSRVPLFQPPSLADANPPHSFPFLMHRSRSTTEACTRSRSHHCRSPLTGVPLHRCHAAADALSW